MEERLPVLVVDDDPGIRKLIAAILSRQGSCPVVAVGTGKEALERVAQGEAFLLALVDFSLPGMDGLEVLDALKKKVPDLEVVIITAHRRVEIAVEAMKRGAYDYLAKPFSAEELVKLVDRVARLQHLVRENTRLKSRLEGGDPLGELVGTTPPMAAVKDLIRMVSANDCTVLLTGESGTGKEMVARAIHRLSRRRDAPFVPVDCSAISPNLLESELFGHERGAFTGADREKAGLVRSAVPGTLFLDEVGEIPQDLQVKLLRVLQEKQIKPVGSEQYFPADVRLVAATHRDLQKMVKEQRFRLDLYYRLNVVEVRLPPLRERKEDLPLLVRHFAARLAGEAEPPVVPPETLERLAGYDWPGNVRELENAIERAWALGFHKEIRVEGLPPRIVKTELTLFERLERDLPTWKEIEKMSLELALRKAGGDKLRAARLLAMSPSTFYRKVKRWHLGT